MHYYISPPPFTPGVVQGGIRCGDSYFPSIFANLGDEKVLEFVLNKSGLMTGNPHSFIRRQKLAFKELELTQYSSWEKDYDFKQVNYLHGDSIFKLTDQKVCTD